MISTDTYPELDAAHIQALFEAGRQAVGEAYAAIGELAAGRPAGELTLLRRLPRKYLPRCGPEFVQRFAATLTTVAWKLAEPNHVYGLACTAEDVALKIILDLARERLADDEQFEDLAEELFEDDTFLMLWDPALDGAEERLPGAANLAFADWFEPFGDREPVHPFVADGPEAFERLWTETEDVADELEDPVTEVFIALGEDWLEAPDQVTDEIPVILRETRAALFPDAEARRLSAAERQQMFDSAAEDVRVLLEAARSEGGRAYDVWLLRDAGPGRPKASQRLHGGLPLEEALNLRKLERMGEYRGVADVELRVYPQDHPPAAGGPL
jgi:hypothetical protein